jgi:chromate transporter
MSQLRLQDIAAAFVRVGTGAFGGWSSTALLLEKEFVDKQKVLTEHQLKTAVTYAQILPGGTQVAIVAHVAYRLAGVRGAVVGTLAYLTPGIGLMVLFAAVYFRYLHGSLDLMQHMGGLIAALCGVILANAYRVGQRHATSWWLWLLVLAVFIIRLAWAVDTLLIIVIFGLGGWLVSWRHKQKATRL